MINFNTLKRVRKFQVFNNLSKSHGFCFACGKNVNFLFKNAITDALSAEWKLSEKQRKSFDVRESMVCNYCGNSLRTRLLAKVLIDFYANKASCLLDLAEESNFKKLKIAEVNSCGNLHQFFNQKTNIHYSEFGSNSKSIPHEDIENMTYYNETFDLVLTSETLEHVTNLEKALREVNRVLKPGGLHIFTIPIILNRRTRSRVTLRNKEIIELLPKSYHGEEKIGFLVAHEFGGDIFKIIEDKGFKIRLYYVNPFIDTHTYVIVAKKK